MANWSEEQFRQLGLFTKRASKKLPPAPEYALHCLVADMLERWCRPGWFYSHIAHGELRTKATAGRLRRMGVRRGLPDFVFWHIEGATAFLELKRRGNRPTQSQANVAFFLRSAGHRYLCTDDFHEATNWLKRLGVLPTSINSIGGDAACQTEERAIA